MPIKAYGHWSYYSINVKTKDLHNVNQGVEMFPPIRKEGLRQKSGRGGHGCILWCFWSPGGCKVPKSTLGPVGSSMDGVGVGGGGREQLCHIKDS